MGIRFQRTDRGSEIAGIVLKILNFMDFVRRFLLFVPFQNEILLDMEGKIGRNQEVIA